MPKRGSGVQDEVDTGLGARIRIRRKELGVSQSELAERIGISFQQVQKYERGTNRVSASTLLAIARALECPPTSLLGVDQTDAAETELLTLLAENGAPELLRAFGRIAERETRQALIAIAEGLAVSPGCRTARAKA